MASSSSYNHHRSFSKSQMYFFKILHIISSTPPSPILPIDLNLSFSSITQQDSQSSSKSTTNNETHVVEEVDDDVAPVLENKHEDNPETSSFQLPRGDSDYLHLLIEAARVLSEKNGSDSEESEKRTGTGTELMTRVVVDLYENEPVVRSKRGRNQALPCRFRDSVIEPLKRKDRKLRLSSPTNAKKRSYNVKR